MSGELSQAVTPEHILSQVEDSFQAQLLVAVVDKYLRDFYQQLSSDAAIQVTSIDHLKHLQRVKVTLFTPLSYLDVKDKRIEIFGMEKDGNVTYPPTEVTISQFNPNDESKGTNISIRYDADEDNQSSFFTGDLFIMLGEHRICLNSANETIGDLFGIIEEQAGNPQELTLEPQINYFSHRISSLTFTLRTFLNKKTSRENSGIIPADRSGLETEITAIIYGLDIHFKSVNRLVLNLEADLRRLKTLNNHAVRQNDYRLVQASLVKDSEEVLAMLHEYRSRLSPAPSDKKH